MRTPSLRQPVGLIADGLRRVALPAQVADSRSRRTPSPITEPATEDLGDPGHLGGVAEIGGDRRPRGAGVRAPVVRATLVGLAQGHPVERLRQERSQPRLGRTLWSKIGSSWARPDQVGGDDVGGQVAGEREGPATVLGADDRLGARRGHARPIGRRAGARVDERLGQYDLVGVVVLVLDVRRAHRAVGPCLERAQAGPHIGRPAMSDARDRTRASMRSPLPRAGSAPVSAARSAWASGQRRGGTRGGDWRRGRRGRRGRRRHWGGRGRRGQRRSRTGRRGRRRRGWRHGVAVGAGVAGAGVGVGRGCRHRGRRRDRRRCGRRVRCRVGVAARGRAAWASGQVSGRGSASGVGFGVGRGVGSGAVLGFAAASGVGSGATTLTSSSRAPSRAASSVDVLLARPGR